MSGIHVIALRASAAVAACAFVLPVAALTLGGPGAQAARSAAPAPTPTATLTVTPTAGGSAGDGVSGSPPPSPVFPPLSLGVSADAVDPEAGHDDTYHVVITDTGLAPVLGLSLHIRLTPDLSIDGAVPAGCFALSLWLDCHYPWLGHGSSIAVDLTAYPSPADAGLPAGIAVFLRYDLIFWAFGHVSGTILAPPAPSPPPTTPPPSPTPRPTTPRPAPRPVVTKPAPAVVPPPPPSAPRRHARAPKREVFVPRAEQMPQIPPRANKPVIPMAVLISAIMVPCVAAAATRFVRRR